MPLPVCALHDDVLPCIAMYNYVHRLPCVVFILITSVGSSENNSARLLKRLFAALKNCSCRFRTAQVLRKARGIVYLIS
jgi:hypothetical protein